MSDYGLTILELALTGKNTSKASITFEKGLNVITGASDTGKSFILQCIDYMFGAKNPPKKIDEAKDYEYIHLLIKRNFDDKKYQLKRSLNKAGVITVSSLDDQPDFKLKPKNDSRSKDNISAFLLDLTNLVDKKVKTNKRNETVSLSFRDLAHLCIVPEEKIITENSPILTSNVIHHTKEKSVFSLVLTGEDDSEILAIEDKKTISVKKSAKIEILEELIEQFTNSEEHYPELIEIEAQIAKLNLYYESLKEQFTFLKSTVDSQEQQRQQLWESFQNLNSELHTKKVLLERFKLLEEKYSSDLDRLISTVEANSVFDNLQPTTCFFCKSAPEHQNHPTIKNYSADEIESACLHEIRNINVLKKELSFTLYEVEKTYDGLTTSLEEKKSKLFSIEKEISELLKPKISNLSDEMQSTQKAISEQKNKLIHVERIDYLQNKIVTVNELVSIRVETSITERQTTKEISIFCKEIEDRFVEWGLFDEPRIGFNSHHNIWDITISGKERGGYGKGFRALTYTAFSLALLKYCLKEKKPHPMFVIIDSPLVVFKEAEPDLESIKTNIKYNFFNDILLEFKDEQVIIFENEDVPEKLKSSMNFFEFTGNENIGRYGFIPVI